MGYFIYGAYMYLTASGAPNQMERGKAAMMTALAGIVPGPGGLRRGGAGDERRGGQPGGTPTVPDPTNSGGGSGTTTTGDGG